MIVRRERCFLTDDTTKGETRDQDKQSGLAGAFMVMPLVVMDKGPSSALS